MGNGRANTTVASESEVLALNTKFSLSHKQLEVELHWSKRLSYRKALIFWNLASDVILGMTSPPSLQTADASYC